MRYEIHKGSAALTSWEIESDRDAWILIDNFI